MLAHHDWPTIEPIPREHASNMQLKGAVQGHN